MLADPVVPFCPNSKQITRYNKFIFTISVTYPYTLLLIFRTEICGEQYKKRAWGSGPEESGFDSELAAAEPLELPLLPRELAGNAGAPTLAAFVVWSRDATGSGAGAGGGRAEAGATGLLSAEPVAPLEGPAPLFDGEGPTEVPVEAAVDWGTRPTGGMTPAEDGACRTPACAGAEVEAVCCFVGSPTLAAADCFEVNGRA